jgi:hypothetical protein
MEALQSVESPIGVLKIGEKAGALKAIEEGSKRQS